MFTSFKLPKPGPAPELPLATSHAPGPAHHPFSVSSLRPPLPHFSSPQFGSGQEPINLGPSLAAAARAEQGEGPTAPGPPGPEDVQKIQENNNNNQSEGESNSDEVTPPKNQGLIKVMSETARHSPGCFPQCWLLQLEMKVKRRFAKVSIVSYSRLSLMIIALATQFHVYLPWGQRMFSIVS